MHPLDAMMRQLYTPFESWIIYLLYPRITIWIYRSGVQGFMRHGATLIRDVFVSGAQTIR
jgi:hypothetical protein